MAFSASFPFAKLNESNYAVWSIKMQSLLIKEGFWNVIETPPEENEAEKLIQDSKAKAMIVLALEDSELVHVKSDHSASEVWRRFKELYQSKTAGAKVVLTRQLYNLKLQPGECINSHLTKMKTLFAELESRGLTYPEDHKAYIVLSSLDKTWEPFVLSLQTVSEDSLNLDFVTSKLLDCDKQRQFMTESKEEAVSNRSVQVAVIKCLNCGKKGHVAKNCFSKNRRQFKTKKGPAGVVKEKPSACMVSGKGLKETPTWILDSACSEIIVNQKDFLQGDLKSSQISHIKLADGTETKVQLSGSAYVSCLNTTIDNVICVPTLKFCLLSVGRLTAEGYVVHFYEKKCTILKDNVICAEGELKDRLYVMKDKNVQGNATCVVNQPLHDNCIHYLHRVLGHSNFGSLKKLTENCGLKVKGCNKFLDCSVCGKVKVKRYPIPKFSTRVTKRPFELVHGDLSGPFTASHGGAKYVFVLVDDFTRYTFCLLLKYKSEVFVKFREWVNMVERQFKCKIGKLQTDRGGEFTSFALTKWLKGKGILHDMTNSSSPVENRVAERKIEELTVMRDAMLTDANLPFYYWGEAINTATYLVNRTWSSSVNQTPFYRLFKRNPSLQHLRIFGSYAYVLIPEEQRLKGQPKWRKLRFVGYDENSKGYRFSTTYGKVVVSRNANFEKHHDWEKIHSNTEVFLGKEPTMIGKSQLEIKGSSIDSNVIPVIRKGHESDSGETQEGEEERVLPRRSERTNKGKPPDRYGYSQGVYVCSVLGEPQSYEEMLKRSPEEVKRWKQAMMAEYEVLQKQDVFDIVDLPKDKKVIGSKWVYRLKSMPDGSLKYKARLVAQGFIQNYLQNFDKTYSPTAKAESMRIMLALALQKGFKIKHFDFECAYLNASLTEEVYLKQASGFEIKDCNKVYKLKKALYGLKQSARSWNTCLNQKLIDMGFKRSIADACVYNKDVGRNQIMILVYVDDICVCAKDDSTIMQILKELNKSFVVKDLGYLKHYLGIDVIQTGEQEIVLSQKKKIEELLDKIGLHDAKAVKTPMATDFHAQVCNDVFEQKDLYRSVIGSLLHISNYTRPDIAYAVGVLSRHVNKPSLKDWQGLKRILRYLKGTIEHGLYIVPGKENDLTCMVDSSFASLDDRKSCTGYIMKYAEVPIVWKSRKQTSISLSTAEAEFAALSEACCEIIWLKQLLKDFGVNIVQPITVYEDSQTCMYLAEAENLKARTKYIAVRYQNVKQMVQTGEIKLCYIETECNTADVFTKPLFDSKHRIMMYHMCIAALRY